MIYCNDQSYMKPSEKTSVPDRSTFEIKHYILPDEVQKGETGSLIYISTDEQTSRHFGKASVQDENLCTQAGARGDDFLIEKKRDDSQVGREHCKYY